MRTGYAFRPRTLGAYGRFGSDGMRQGIKGYPRELCIEYSIRHDNWIVGRYMDLNDDAMAAITDFINASVPGARSRNQHGIENAAHIIETTLIPGLERAILANENLNQLALDKAWPIFWGLIVHGGTFLGLGYTRESAKEKIATFCEIAGFTKKDWAWFCNKSHHYLFHQFDRRGDFFIRWPHELQKYTRGINLPADGSNFFQRLFMQEQNIHEREFEATIRDLEDVLRHPMGLRALWQMPSWETFRAALRRFEAQHHRLNLQPGGLNFADGFIGQPGHYEWRGVNFVEAPQQRRATATTIGIDEVGPSLTLDTLREAMEILARNNVPAPQYPQWEGMDIGRELQPGDLVTVGEVQYVVTGTAASGRPGKTEKYEWMEKLPATFESGAYSARLLADNCAVWDEGERMQHCLYRSYGHRIKSGSYAAYHIDVPGSKHGFTVGFVLKLEAALAGCYSMVPSKWVRDEFKGWEIDQVRGKKNSLNNDSKVDLFITALLAKVIEATQDAV